MPLKLNDKKSIVADVAEIASKSVAAVAVKYQGLTVAEMTRFRAEARKKGILIKVVRNTLARRALEGTQFACMQEELVGPLMLVFSQTEVSAPARLVRDFLKEYEKLAVKVLSLDGRLVSANEIEAIAKLPSRDEAIAMLMAVMKAPITKFVRTLSEPPAKFVRLLSAVRDKKQAA